MLTESAVRLLRASYRGSVPWDQLTAMARARPSVAVLPWQLLTAVMPRADLHLVPPEGRPYVTDPRLGMSHAYPTSCARASYLRRRAHERVPLLPPMRVPGLPAF